MADEIQIMNQQFGDRPSSRYNLGQTEEEVEQTETNEDQLVETSAQQEEDKEATEVRPDISPNQREIDLASSPVEESKQPLFQQRFTGTRQTRYYPSTVGQTSRGFESSRLSMPTPLAPGTSDFAFRNIRNDSGGRRIAVGTRYDTRSSQIMRQSPQQASFEVPRRGLITSPSPARGIAPVNAMSPILEQSPQQQQNQDQSEYELRARPEVEEFKLEPTQPKDYEVDHSTSVSNDFGHFLFEENLADLKIVVRKGKEQFCEFSEAKPEDTVKICAHKFVLSARCQYFFTQFCHSEWKDKNQSEACFTQFSEGPMREFLKYLYTGKLTMSIDKIIGILRISTYFGMERIVETCRSQLNDPNVLSATDLCKLFEEVRGTGQDFDDMKAFFTEIIPKRVDNQMIPGILREIWQTGCEESGLQGILLRRIQNGLSDVLDDQQGVKSEFFKLPLDALTHVVSSSQTCVSEMKLFKAINDRLSELQDCEDFKQNIASQNQVVILKQLMAKFIRLSQIDVKKLVTDIKFSGVFEDDLIFKAIQYNVARDVLDQEFLMNDLRFQPRGLSTCFDQTHYDLSVELQNDQHLIKRIKLTQSNDDSCLSAIMSEYLPLHGIHYWEFKVRVGADPNKLRISDEVVQQLSDKESETDKSEVKPILVNQNGPQKPRSLFVGLCQVNDNPELENTHLVQSSVMLNVLDSSFWCNGSQMQGFAPKGDSKIKNPFDFQDRQTAMRNAARGQQAILRSSGHASSQVNLGTESVEEDDNITNKESDIVRIAVDLRYASNFSTFWQEAQNDDAEEEVLDSQVQSDNSRNIGRANLGTNTTRVFGAGGNPGQRATASMINQQRALRPNQNRPTISNMRSMPNQNSRAQGFSNGASMASFNYTNLERRIQESMRNVRSMRQHQNIRDHHHLNLFLNINSADRHNVLVPDLSLFFQQPTSLCKIHYSVNGGDWSDGVDLNLMHGIKKAPLNLCVSMPSEMDYQPELLMSRAGYFNSWDQVPKEAIFLKTKEPTIQMTEEEQEEEQQEMDMEQPKSAATQELENEEVEQTSEI